MVFITGQRIEVVGNGVVASKSFFGGRILDFVGSRRLSVVYDTLVDRHGQPRVAVVRSNRVRPVPPQVVADSVVGDVVDVWHRGAWWLGVVEGVTEVAYDVFFGYLEEADRHGSFRKDDVRVNQMHIAVGGFDYWIYQRFAEMVPAVGSRVEVVRTGVSGGRNFVSARVVNVMGRRSLVVFEGLRNERDEPVVDLVRNSCMRPYPSDVVLGFVVGDAVNVSAGGCWWHGVVEGVSEDGYDVFFEYMEEGARHGFYPREAVRPNQIHQVYGGANFWLYRTV